MTTEIRTRIMSVGPIAQRKAVCGMAVCLLALCATLLAGCASGATSNVQDGPGPFADLSAYPAADMSSYDCAAGYEGTYRFADMTVREVADEMEKGSTFMLYAGYNHCPWCNSVLNYLNDILDQRGITAAYIDTRKDPSWQSNIDIDDYDLFVQLFGDVLDEDDEGLKHLYVPHLFFVKDGVLVADHAGTVPSQQEASDPLTQEQVDEYRALVGESLDKLAG